MRPWGQGDWRGVVLAAMVSLGTTVAGWFGGTIWTRYNAEEDMRRSREEDHRILVEDHQQLVELRALVATIPFQALSVLPSRMSTLEAAWEAREQSAPMPRRRKQAP